VMPIQVRSRMPPCRWVRLSTTRCMAVWRSLELASWFRITPARR